MNNLQGRKVLVTGATGCIGGRLIERLHGLGAQPSALVRTPGRAVRLARLPVDVEPGDLLDQAALERAVQGCDVVFHCAYGSDGTPDSLWHATVDGTGNLLAACQAADVRRFVHVSTAVVHESGHTLVDERTPLAEDSPDLYVRAKIAAEQLVWQAARNGLPVTVIRPAIVYGPYAQYWTTGIVMRLKEDTFAVVGNASGLCHPIYVDDVVEALVLGGSQPAAVGEAYLISDRPVAFAEYFARLAALVPGSQIQRWALPDWQREMRKRALISSQAGMLVSYLGSPRFVEMARAMAPGPVESAARCAANTGAGRRVARYLTDLYWTRRRPRPAPGPTEYAAQSTRCVYSTQKARTELGFRPRITLDEGLRRTADWLRWAGYLDGTHA